MGSYIKGDLVLIPFPYSDLSKSKRRPALVIHDLVDDDIILCQVTSKTHGNKYEIPFDNKNMSAGALPLPSYILPFKIFTGCKTQLLSNKQGDMVLGHLKQDKLNEVIKSITHFITT